MKKCTKAKALILGAMLCAIVSSLATPALAYTNKVSGNTVRIAENGVTYSCKSVGYSDAPSSSGAYAVAQLDIVADKQVPAGYMGGWVSMYTDTEELMHTTRPEFNSSAGLTFTTRFQTFAMSAQYFYAQSVALLWNTSLSGYRDYDVPRTPNFLVAPTNSMVLVTPMAASEFASTVSISINSNQQTYGSGLSLTEDGKMPDLISAIGTNGEHGYVYSAEVFSIGDVNSPEEAINAIYTAYTVPLYLSDGVTVIGNFVVGE